MSENLYWHSLHACRRCPSWAIPVPASVLGSDEAKLTISFLPPFGSDPELVCPASLVEPIEWVLEKPNAFQKIFSTDHWLYGMAYASDPEDRPKRAS